MASNITSQEDAAVSPGPAIGEVSQSRKPATWDRFFAALIAANVAADFMDEKERKQGRHDRDPFKTWRE
jgi:antitoxin VapB